MRFFVSFVFLLICSTGDFFAIQKAFASDQPIEIVADGTLEWHRGELYFEASENVEATQGDTAIYTDTLRALYRDNVGSGIDIYRLQADGNVKIVAQQSEAFGDVAKYSVEHGHAVMTGNNLRMISQDQIVTARDRFEYWVQAGKLEAVGKAVAVRAGDKVEADKLVAVFEQNAQGKRVLKTLEAIGSVVITTETEILRGERGIYNAQTNIAELHDDVTITRGPNVVQGTKAEVDLDTNISKIHGGGETGGRVRGVFFPGSESITPSAGDMIESDQVKKVE